MAEQFTRRTRGRAGSVAVVALTLGMMPALASSAQAAEPVLLGTADSFAVLAGSRISNIGHTTVTGNIGVCCTGVARTGFGPLPPADTVTQPGGTQYTGTGSPAEGAQFDLDVAYLDAEGRSPSPSLPVNLSLSGTEANPLIPGVYESISHGALAINQGLWLDFGGDPNAVFIFQGTTLTTAAAAAGSVTITNGGATPSTCNIFWQLSDPTASVTLGAGSAFKGTTMSLGASALGTGTTVQGRILTRGSKAVDTDTNTITRNACYTAPAAGGGSSPTTPIATPTPTPTPAATPAAPTPTAPTPTRVSRPGGAQLAGPNAAVRGPFGVTVTGRDIASVTFYIDGKRRSTVNAVPGRSRFTLKIDPRRQSRRVHRVTARVTYTPASGKTTTTRRVTYRRPPAVAGPPRFTG